MKEPLVLHRRRRPSSSLAAKKMKLVCSFNGSFQPRPPSGKLRYVGGETRIISVDRSIELSKLRSKILDLFPATRPRYFSLKYQLPNLGCDDAPLLVSVASDDDVRCMIEEYDKLDLYGKHARLWLFVCTEDNDDVDVNSFIKKEGTLPVNCGESKSLCTKNGVASVKGVKAVSGCEALKGQFNCELTKNLAKYGDVPLRNIVLKQQLLARQSACVNETKMRIACRSENQKYDHPLVDLVPETQFSMGCDSVIHSKDPHKMGVLDDRSGRNIMPPGSENSGNLVQFQGSHLQPLYPRDGNLWAETTPSRCLLRSYGQVVCNGIGIGMGIDNFEKPVPAIRQFPRQVDGSNAFSICNGGDAKQGLRNEQLPKNVSNRENIMPCDCNCHYGNDHFVGSTFFLRYSCTADRCLKFGVNDIRNQRISSYHARNYGNYSVEMGGHRIVRLDGRIPVGKFSHGLRPNPNISKQSISTRVDYPNSWKLWSGFPEQELEGRVSMIDSRLTKGTSSPDVQYGNEKLRGQVGPEVSLYKYSSSEECHFAFHGPYAGPESPLSCVVAVATQEGLSPRSNNVTCKIPYQSLYGKFHDIPRNLHPSHHDLGTRQPLMDVEKVIDISRFSDDMAFKNKTEFKCNSKLSGEEAIIDSSSSYRNDAHNLQVGDASLLDFSLDNLSLSTSGEGSPMLSSAATTNLAKASLKPQAKPEDAFDGGQLNIDPQVYESDRVPNPSLKVVAKVEDDHVNEKEIQLDLTSGLGIDEKAGNSECHKCTKVIGGIPGGLDAFYKNLATRELQTIKNFDLELIKELGSGTYGTVHHGKWKGSDVAIKRIKPSCFSEDSLEKDRLVADFWKEAHILGELHHPNIVAFYGVVTDGPVTNLATVTEYMVNGSLKQVLRRKDRTIDRRKRLIIAMDAAFGMEYLHGKNIVHFDLKSHNFLMNMRDPRRPVCKIGDLGLSKIKQRTLVSGGICGTIPWMAPELVNSKDNMVTEKVDVYSFGVVMWELLTGEEPYANMRSEEVIAGIIKGNLRPEVPSWCDPSWRSLMERCWSSDPDSRPSFSEIAKELRAMLPP